MSKLPYRVGLPNAQGRCMIYGPQGWPEIGSQKFKQADAEALAARLNELAALQAENAALRELLRRALSCVEHQARQCLDHETAVYEHRAKLAADITTALLGKGDGNAEH